MAVGLALLKLGWAQIRWWVVPGALISIVCAGLLLGVGHARYAQAHEALTATDELTSGGRLPMTVSLVTILLGVTALATVLA